MRLILDAGVEQQIAGSTGHAVAESQAPFAGGQRVPIQSLKSAKAPGFARVSERGDQHEPVGATA